MNRKTAFILLNLAFLCASSFIVNEALGQGQNIGLLDPIEKTDRVLILAPHPDDEAIACAGIIQQAIAVGAQVNVAYLTNGDHNQIAFIVYEKRITLRKGEFIHMGEVRRAEAISAMKVLGLGQGQLVFLGYPDFGTFTIFNRYWKTQKPYKSILTRISVVPYKENLSPGAPYMGESILKDLENVLLKYKPNKIFVSHPADTNADHKTTYLFLQIALLDLQEQLGSPKVYPYLVHCVGWPLPRRFHPELGLEPPKAFLGSEISWKGFGLTEQQLERKHQAILSYKSQTESSAFYLLSFARKTELFGDYPAVELKKQLSLKEKGVSFFGFSDMFTDSEIGLLGDLGNFIEEKGTVSYTVVDDALLIRVEKKKELNSRFGLMIYIFGYKYNTPFAAMPKINIITKYNRLKVLEGKKIIKPEGVSMQIDSNALILKLPLQLLGKPDVILTSLKAYVGVLPVDATGFRRIIIK